VGLVAAPWGFELGKEGFPLKFEERWWGLEKIMVNICPL
jgi:hypothetical protein